MVQVCAAYGCKTRAGDGFSFFSFPKDKTICKAWIHAMYRANFQPTKHSKLCSKHFKPEDFEPFFYGNPKLKKESVPTIFDLPKNIGPKKIKSRKPPAVRNNPTKPESPPVPESFSSKSEFDYPTNPPPVKRENSPVQIQETLACSSPATDSSLNIVIHSITSLGEKRNFRESYVGDYRFTDLTSPTKAQKFIELITEKLSKKTITISKLKRQNKRLNEKILSMEKENNDLKRKLDINGIA